MHLHNSSFSNHAARKADAFSLAGRRRPATFRASIEALLAIAVKEAGATSYSLFEALPHAAGQAPEFILVAGQMLIGQHVPAAPTDTRQVRLEDLSGAKAAVVTFALPDPAHAVGILEFRFPWPLALTPKEEATLNHTADSIASILRFVHNATALQVLTARIAEVQSELADLKISERARGVAAGGRKDKAVILNAHVSTVLTASQSEEALRTQLAELEDRLDERRLLVRAKELLQANRGLTEEESYTFLREASRRTRRRLRTVAQELIDSPDGIVPAPADSP